MSGAHYGASRAVVLHSGSLERAGATAGRSCGRDTEDGDHAGRDAGQHQKVPTLRGRETQRRAGAISRMTSQLRRIAQIPVRPVPCAASGSAETRIPLHRAAARAERRTQQERER